MRGDVVVEELDSMPTWSIPEPAPMRTKGPIIQLEAVSFAYPAAANAQGR